MYLSSRHTANTWKVFLKITKGSFEKICALADIWIIFPISVNISVIISYIMIYLAVTGIIWVSLFLTLRSRLIAVAIDSIVLFHRCKQITSNLSLQVSGQYQLFCVPLRIYEGKHEEGKSSLCNYLRRDTLRNIAHTWL